MKEDVRLMKGNEAIAHAAIRYGCDGYFGYPITPQSEVLETLEELMPWETTGMVVLQAESEVAAVLMPLLQVHFCPAGLCQLRRRIIIWSSRCLISIFLKVL